MNNLSDIGKIKEILSKHGFTFSKSLGQNFLINPSVCPRMAEYSGAGEGVGVIEVGPGIGVLTNELFKHLFFGQLIPVHHNSSIFFLNKRK